MASPSVEDTIPDLEAACLGNADIDMQPPANARSLHQIAIHVAYYEPLRRALSDNSGACHTTPTITPSPLQMSISVSILMWTRTRESKCRITIPAENAESLRETPIPDIFVDFIRRPTFAARFAMFRRNRAICVIQTEKHQVLLSATLTLTTISVNDFFLEPFTHPFSGSID
jgi:hypothetical protein